MIKTITRAFSALSNLRASENPSLDKNSQHFSAEGKSKKLLFQDIVYQNGVKSIFIKALLSDIPVHILLIGSPGSAKSMFLSEIMRCFKSSLFVVGSNSSKAGIINQVFEKSPKYLLIDELDKMNSIDQTSLLNLMETGLVSETKIGKTREIQVNLQIFATGNSIDKIIEPLRSRFIVLTLPEYTFEEFVQIAVSRLGDIKIDQETACTIAENVWNHLESKDIRDVLKVGSLISKPEDVSFLIRMMNK